MAGRRRELAHQALRKFMRASREKLMVDRGSIYGSVVVLPQVARACGWPWALTAVSFRHILGLLLTFFVQASLLRELALVEKVVDPYGGKMSLCQYAAGYTKCVHGLGTIPPPSPGSTPSPPLSPDCVGPGGSTYTRWNLFGDYDIWSTRVFVRDALLAAFPEREPQIRKSVDPGEYGLESNVARFVCVVVFCMTMVKEATDLGRMLRLLFELPSSSSSEGDTDLTPRDEDPDEHEDMMWCVAADDGQPASSPSFPSGSPEVRFRICGMPLGWKLWNLLGVWVPKFLVWCWMILLGTWFLYETGTIEDLILNALALTFVNEIDELVFEVIADHLARSVMDELEDYEPPPAEGDDELDDMEHLFGDDEDDDEAEEPKSPIEVHQLTPREGGWRQLGVRRGRRRRGIGASWSRVRGLVAIVPVRILGVFVLVWLFHSYYLKRYCERRPDGSWVSQSVYPPSEVRPSAFALFLDQMPFFSDSSGLRDGPTASWSSTMAHEGEGGNGGET